MNKNTKKLTMMSLILMIFTSVFGFNNMPRSFYLMGYAAIPWYIVSGITFFVPYALMMAEFGSAFKDEKGGIYSWMDKSVGPKFAFMGTFMWYASYVIWMVSSCSSIWINVSSSIFGKDTTQTWGVFGLKPTQVLGLLGICLIITITFTATKGLDKVKKVTAIGGSAVAFLNIMLIVCAVFLLVAHGGKLAQPIDGIKTFTTSPNPNYLSTISIFSFLVYAIFAYGGIEVVGGLVDQTENPEKTFPKGVVISAAIITVGYSAGILLVGIFTNWTNVMSVKGVHLGNASYVVMANLGNALGQAFGASDATCIAMGHGMARFVGASMFLALSGAFFTLMFAPLKQMIEGTPAKLWPGKMGEIKNGMPINAMWIQAAIVCVMIALVSFGGDNMSKFFDILVAMTNVAMTLPYMFLAFAFPAFKKKKEIHKPFEVFKTTGSATIWTTVVMLTVGFANFFCIIEPAINGDMKTTLWSVAGPIFFAVVAVVMFSSYEKNVKKEDKAA